MYGKGLKKGLKRYYIWLQDSCIYPAWFPSIRFDFPVVGVTISKMPFSTHTASTQYSHWTQKGWWTMYSCAVEDRKPERSGTRWHLYNQWESLGSRACLQTEALLLLDVLFTKRSRGKECKGCAYKERFQLMLIIIMLPAAAELLTWVKYPPISVVFSG